MEVVREVHSCFVAKLARVGLLQGLGPALLVPQPIHAPQLVDEVLDLVEGRVLRVEARGHRECALGLPPVRELEDVEVDRVVDEARVLLGVLERENRKRDGLVAWGAQGCRTVSYFREALSVSLSSLAVAHTQFQKLIWLGPR